MLSSRGLAISAGNANSDLPMKASNKNAGANKRRAFRDVTNATNGSDAGGKNEHLPSKKAAKSSKTFSAAVQNLRDENLPVRRPTQVRGKRTDVFQPAQQEQEPSLVPEAEKDTTSGYLRTIPDLQPGTTSYQHTGKVDNIDERDANDPLCASEYVVGMYEHFRERELLTSVKPLYMDAKQPFINGKMRAILIDWLVEVHLKYRQVPETLYLTVNLIDRYLERNEVSRSTLQLVGVACLLLASKYEEIYPPEVRDLVYICDGAYQKQEILDMEENVLKTLQYRITIPSAHGFLVRYLKAAHADKKMVQVACYILDGSLLSYPLLNYLPSQLAAAAVLIARRSIGRNSWSPTLLAYSGYCEEDIVPVARDVMREKASKAPELGSVQKKYGSSKYGYAADTPMDFEF